MTSKKQIQSGPARSMPPRLVPANVILKPASGRRVVEAGAEIRPGNVQEFLPSREALEEARRLLEELGFQIGLFANTHISIRGPKALYERIFGVRLAERAAPDADAFARKGRSRARYFVASRTPRLPKPLAGVVEAVEFPAPVVYQLPSATPPALGYDHMVVPDDVARDMDALKAHARGITGAGIKLAMVDSGFATPFHPYYVAHGYDIQPVVADPSDLSPGDDSYGHGTAMAACALAVAPGVTFTTYKIGALAGDAFSRAVQDGNHIITNSWGVPALDTGLRLTINQAVGAGIVVLFATGNHVPVLWPGSEPAVISVGGVFVDKDDTLRASDHAVSGTNAINPSRQCPDLCGICGLTPKGILIAMPTQVGSSGDVALAGAAFPDQDETAANDGWLVSSGTSAATAMVAGVAALVMQADPATVGNPAAVRAALLASCLDVTTGTSASGEAAGPGLDLATGAGLVQAYRAIRGTDLWIKDNPDSDIGWVPTHNRRPAWPPYVHWLSPDIKVFSAPLVMPAAEFDSTSTRSPVFDEDNFVYVRIRNRGTQATAEVTAGLFYADPATNLVFPADWQTGQSGVPDQGRLQVGGANTNLQTFPSVAAGGQNVLPQAFVWRPPDPTLATQTQVLADGRVVGHFCLLVRLASADDPITAPGGGQSSVIDDNNIGMANQGVYSAAAGSWFNFRFFVRGRFDPAGPVEHDLLLDLGRLPRGCQVTLEAPQPWPDGLQHLRAERVTSVKLALRSGARPAGLRGLVLQPRTRILLSLAVQVPAGTRPGDYPVTVLQRSAGHPLGGITLIARVTAARRAER